MQISKTWEECYISFLEEKKCYKNDIFCIQTLKWGKTFYTCLLSAEIFQVLKPPFLGLQGLQIINQHEII